ncbi:hypothetical protein H310_00108 [Aphanomyces invadans]|uniref:Uncharacterized protein n=1 Tax=Aphanomyces invadans TaxID=157072 RepID=A0A024UUG1_9STRA|nr:hypothetical protein H310_00108 [Aphanomyces invadans]ETW09557.1 hypothetical protein H310_00108 [Aphanomyces invadans]|eukprot:XP_008860968.1 hypothetical protein H310_00108 [Aphanomyces invadans]
MNIVAERRKFETEHESAELQRRLIADQVMQIPTLFPWTRIDVADSALCRKHDSSWNEPLREALVHDISKLYVRLMKNVDVLNAHSIIHNAANITRLHGQLLVQVNRIIDVPSVLERIKTASKSDGDTATALRVEHPRRKYTSAVLDASAGTAAGHSNNIAHTTSTGALGPLSPPKPPPLPSGGLPHAQSPKKFLHVPRDAYHSSRTVADAATPHNQKKEAEERRRRTMECHKPLLVNLPRNPVTLRELLDKTDDSSDDVVTRFRDRPILADATFDLSAPLPKRDGSIPKITPKARYLMRENCSALPHHHTIFDDYVIPREVWEAIESEAAQPTSTARPLHRFDPIALDDFNVSCYFARACPRERDTLSSALHAMEIRPEKPMVRNVTDMVLDSQFQEKNNTLLAREVKTLYMATNDVYHEFRQQLHQPMKVAELVDMAIKCALNDMSMSMDDAIVSTEAVVEIPVHLTPPVPQTHRRNKNSTPDLSLATGSHRGKPKMSRRELMESMHDVDTDKRLVGLWTQRRADESSHNRPFDPMALDPLLSVRFENVWRGLLMPTTMRLDMALKYSHPDHAHRLPDAVLLWEVCAAWIQEREGMWDQVKKLLKGGDPSRMALNDVKDKLIVLTGVTKKVRQCIAMAYDEVGDFVTYDDEFYIRRIHDQHRRMHDDLMAMAAWRDME